MCEDVNFDFLMDTEEFYFDTFNDSLIGVLGLAKQDKITRKLIDENKQIFEKYSKDQSKTKEEVEIQDLYVDQLIFGKDLQDNISNKQLRNDILNNFIDFLIHYTDNNEIGISGKTDNVLSIIENKKGLEFAKLQLEYPCVIKIIETLFESNQRIREE